MSQVTNTSFSEAQEREKRFGGSPKLELGGVLEVLRGGSQKNYRAIRRLEHSQPIQRILDLKAERNLSSQINPMAANVDPELNAAASTQSDIEAKRAQVNNAYDTSRGEG